MKSKLLTTGRVKQKQGTRDKILATAQQLLQTQAAFSLEDVARAMPTSRATIYRYFSTVDILCAEAALSLQVKQSADLLAEVQHLPLPEALLYVQDYFNQLALRHETAFRKYLSVVLAESVKSKGMGQLRGARRPAALEAVLRAHAPHLAPEQRERLRQIITVLSGIEPMIANKDVNGLSNEASNELLEWALRMIFKGMEVESR
jgi:AcrR family transcriptional regulator